MKRWPMLLMALMVSIIGGHMFTLWAAPRVIMSRAMAAMEDRGVPLHSFVLSPRITAQTQTVVRPSPDLAYSICRFDLDEAPRGLRIQAAGYDKLASISIFDARTINVGTVRVGRNGADIVLVPSGSKLASRLPKVLTETETGLVLIRRLAPGAADYRYVAEVAKQDRCAPI